MPSSIYETKNSFATPKSLGNKIVLFVTINKSVTLLLKRAVQTYEHDF
jgi:hypothetical protein